MRNGETKKVMNCKLFYGHNALSEIGTKCMKMVYGKQWATIPLTSDLVLYLHVTYLGFAVVMCSYLYGEIIEKEKANGWIY